MGANYLTNQREILANAFLLGNQKSQLKAQKSLRNVDHKIWIIGLKLCGGSDPSVK